MQITKIQMLAIMPNARNVVDNYLPYINKYAEQFEINTPLRMAHYLAQIAHESMEMNAIQENLSYSAERLRQIFPKYFTVQNAKKYAHNPQAIANRVYANRMGNGNEQSGDGWRFKGRGFIQLTGRDNYFAYDQYLLSTGVNADLMHSPELLARPVGSVKSSMWFFAVRANCLQRADKDDVLAITKKINGGTNGIVQRKQYLARAKKVFKIA